MSFCAPTIFLLVIICQTVSTLELASFGDLVEADVALTESCKSISERNYSKARILNGLWNCATNLINTTKNDALRPLQIPMCRKRQDYFSCWDSFKSDIQKACGPVEKSKLPSVYRASHEALCGNDNGAKIMDKIQTILKSGKAETFCMPNQTHWLQKCEDDVTLMTSPNLCNRHQAIETCLSKLVCPNYKAADFFIRIYSDGRAVLRCDSRSNHAQEMRHKNTNIFLLILAAVSVVFLTFV